MAKFNSARLFSKRQFRSLAGIETGTFRELADRLRPHWRARIVAPKIRPGRPWSVGGPEDHPLVLLILYRCAMTQYFMACLYQTDKSTISRYLRRIEAVAGQVLGVKRVVRVSREEVEALIIDSPEQPIQRPSRKQRCWYSGKKKAPHHQNRNCCDRRRPHRPTAVTRGSRTTIPATNFPTSKPKQGR